MRYLLVPAILLAPFVCSAQLLTDDGAAITVQTGAQLTVKGDVLVTSGATFTNGGTIDLNGDITNNSGTALFTATPGQVVMNGTAQSIGGSSVTAFDGLDLQCATLTLQQDAVVGGTYPSPAGVLALNDAIVQLNSKRLVVNNGTVIAITRTTGQLVSETDPLTGYGEVEWNIGTGTGSYVVPFGTGAAYLPVSANITTSGTGPGSLVFATYPTDPFASPNNRPLPAGLSALTNMGGTENAPNVLDRFWPITASGYTTAPSAALTFTYQDSEWNTGANTITEAALQAQRFNGSVWSFPPIGVVSTTANTVTTSVTNAFDQVWALVQSSTPLPVELLYFDALPDGREVRCSWATATEQDNDFFTVERSADGTLFEDIGEVEGAGSSHATLHYAFMDPSPLPGLSYYRLQQTDFDGSAVLSNIVPVWMQAGAVDVPLVLWPNPAHEVLNIVGTAAGERLSVWDGSGRLTLEVGAAQEGLTVVDVSHLPEGVYMLRIGGAGKERVSRFVRADR